MTDRAARRALDDARLQALAGAVPAATPRLPPRAARALRLATEAGAPLVAALDSAEAAVADEAARERAIRVASAQSRAVAAGLLVLPALLLPLLSALLGLDPVGFYTTPTGAAVAGLATLLLAAGGLWARRLVRRVATPRRRRAHPLATGAGAGVVGLLLGGPPVAAAAAVAAAWWARRRHGPGPPPAGLDEAVDLVATATAAGLGAGAALRLAAARLPALAGALRGLAVRLELDRPPDGLLPGVQRLGRLLAEARRLGAPAVPALRDLARRLREEEQARALAAAERLPAHLTFPTALCLLPGSLLLVGAPLVASGLATAGL